MIYKFELIIFSNKQAIYVKHYTRDQKILRISRPAACPYLPSMLYSSSMSKPKIELQKVELKGKMPNYVISVAWYNEIRKESITWKSKEQKYFCSNIYSKNLGNVFIFGINTTMLKEQDQIIRCEFSHN